MLLLIAALSVALLGQKPCASPHGEAPAPTTMVTGVELRTVAGKAGSREINSFQELAMGGLRLRIDLK
jgi:hypothetical protein